MLRAREIEASFTMQVFQELVLGSRAFEQVYGLKPRFDEQGYLRTRDHPALDGVARGHLLAWLRRDGQHVAVMTARPGRWAAAPRPSWGWRGRGWKPGRW